MMLPKETLGLLLLNVIGFAFMGVIVIGSMFLVGWLIVTIIDYFKNKRNGG